MLGSPTTLASSLSTTILKMWMSLIPQLARLGGREKAISWIVVHEVYRLTFQKEGRQVAQLRAGLIEKDFHVIPVDEELAVISAEMRQEYEIPMADSIIAATASHLRAVCVTDDSHIQKIRGIKTRWIE